MPATENDAPTESSNTNSDNCCCCTLTTEQKKAIGFYALLLALASGCTLAGNCIAGGSIFSAATWCNLALNDSCVTGVACAVSHSKTIRDCATLFGKSASTASVSIREYPTAAAPASRSTQPNRMTDPTSSLDEQRALLGLGPRRGK